MTEGSAGILARDVTVTYRNGLTALSHASFEIPRGTVTALVGVNGAGKSTLFKAIMGFVPVAGGEIRLLGLTVPEALRRNLVAYVPQSEDVDWSFPVLVEDVVMMGRYGHMGFLRRPSAADRAAVEAALARVGMAELRHRQIGELSGGQRKRVALAQVLIRDPDILLMDEPFGPLDAQTRLIMHELLLRLWSQDRKAVLFVTHDLEEAIALSDRVVIMSTGPEARIIGDFPIPLERPRDIAEIKLTPEFLRLHRDIWHLLKEQVMQAYGLQPEGTDSRGQA